MARINPQDLSQAQVQPEAQIRDTFIAQGVKQTQSLYEFAQLEKVVPIIGEYYDKKTSQEILAFVKDVQAKGQEALLSAEKDLKPFIDSGQISRFEVGRAKSLLGVAIARNLAQSEAVEVENAIKQRQNDINNGLFQAGVPNKAEDLSKITSDIFSSTDKTIKESNADLIDETNQDSYWFRRELNSARAQIRAKADIFAKELDIAAKEAQFKDNLDASIQSFFEETNNTLLYSQDPTQVGPPQSREQIDASIKSGLQQIFQEAYEAHTPNIAGVFMDNLKAKALELQNQDRYSEAADLVASFGRIKINNIAIDSGKQKLEYQELLKSVTSAEEQNTSRQSIREAAKDSAYIRQLYSTDGSIIRQAVGLSEDLSALTQLINKIKTASQEEIDQYTIGNPDRYPALINELQGILRDATTTSSAGRQDDLADIELMIREGNYDAAKNKAELLGPSAKLFYLDQVNAKLEKDNELYGTTGTRGAVSDPIIEVINDPLAGKSFGLEFDYDNSKLWKDRATTLKDKFSLLIKQETDPVKKEALRAQYREEGNTLISERNRSLFQETLRERDNVRKVLEAAEQGKSIEATLDSLSIPLERRQVYYDASQKIQNRQAINDASFGAQVLGEYVIDSITAPSNTVSLGGVADIKGGQIVPFTKNPFAEAGVISISDRGQATLTVDGRNRVAELTNKASEAVKSWTLSREAQELSLLPLDPITGRDPYNFALNKQINKAKAGILVGLLGNSADPKDLEVLAPSRDSELYKQLDAKIKENQSTLTTSKYSDSIQSFIETHFAPDNGTIEKELLVTSGTDVSRFDSSTSDKKDYSLRQLIRAGFDRGSADTVRNNYTIAGTPAYLTNEKTNELSDLANENKRPHIPKDLLDFVFKSARDNSNIKESQEALKLIPKIIDRSSDNFNAQLAALKDKRETGFLKADLIQAYYDENLYIPMSEHLQNKLFYNKVATPDQLAVLDDRIIKRDFGRKVLFENANANMLDYHNHKMFNTKAELFDFLADDKQVKAFEEIHKSTLNKEDFKKAQLYYIFE